MAVGQLEAREVQTKQPPKMTIGRATLVVLMDRYLTGFLDPFITLIELHKLLYFMQIAGEPLRLNFRKHYYGPYAENLRHVLNEIERHFIVGYADGGDNPRKQIELVPGALRDAKTLLQEHPGTAARLERVSSLVEGFESPFGLELLATVHWLLHKEGVIKADKVVERFYAWNEMKQQFTRRQIRLALEWLIECGWGPNPAPAA